MSHSHQKGKWDATLFDLDGTLTKKSTIPGFFLRALPSKRKALAKGMKALPLLAQYWGGAQFEKLLPDFSEALIAGAQKGNLDGAGEDLIKTIWKKGMHGGVLRALLDDLDAGKPVAIATGGLPYCAQALARKLGAERDLRIFASELEFEGENAKKVTKVLVGKEKLIAVDWGKEKGAILRAFGNSSGDHEMLRAVERPWWVKPNGEIIPWDSAKKR